MLVGRDRERSVLDGTVSASRAGRGEVLAVVGEAGIGKSALLAYAAEQARGMSVLRARGVQSEALIPFGGLFELLCARPSARSVASRPLGPRPSRVRWPCGRREEKTASPLGPATLSLLTAHAESSPVLAVVDDAHWLDGSSANALLIAARRLVGDPVAILLAVREGEPSLLDGADLPRLRLHGLDLQGSTELLRRRAKNRGEDEVTDRAAGRLHQETGGNPLALLELGEQRTAVAARSRRRPRARRPCARRRTGTRRHRRTALPSRPHRHRPSRA